MLLNIGDFCSVPRTLCSINVLPFFVRSILWYYIVLKKPRYSWNKHWSHVSDTISLFVRWLKSYATLTHALLYKATLITVTFTFPGGRIHHTTRDNTCHHPSFLMSRQEVIRFYRDNATIQNSRFCFQYRALVFFTQVWLQTFVIPQHLSVLVNNRPKIIYDLTQFK